MSSRELIVCADKGTIASASTQFVLSEISQSRSPKFMLALSGGTTPAATYDQLARTNGAGELITSRCGIFFSDERAVGPEDPNSNFRTARQHLFEPLGLPDRIIHRIVGEATDLGAEAAHYAALIREKATGTQGMIPRFDLTLLGMGADGHTASLFPEYDFASDTDIVVAPFVESKGTRRISFSVPLINASRVVLFLIVGKDKAGALRRIFATDKNEHVLPAARVDADRTVWMVDSEAASLLDWTGKVLTL